jgi:hypothetical protein
MDEQRTVFVGIDVSKDRLDVHLRPSGDAFFVPREGKGMDDLVIRLQGLSVALVVLEATGGFEATVAAALASVGLPLCVVNPRQFRDSAQPQTGSSFPWQTPAAPAPAPTGSTTIGNQSVMKQCGAQWQAAKAAGPTGGATWP